MTKTCRRRVIVVREFSGRRFGLREDRAVFGDGTIAIVAQLCTERISRNMGEDGQNKQDQRKRSVGSSAAEYSKYRT